MNYTFIGIQARRYSFWEGIVKVQINEIRVVYVWNIWDKIR